MSYLLQILIEAEDKASSVLGGLGNAITGLGKAGLAVAGGGLLALGGVLVAGIGDAREAAKITAQTEQVIKTMGNSAGVSAEHVASFASSLSAAAGKSLFGDDQIQSATNMLLTFGNIKGKALDLATTLTVDMAQALDSTPEKMSIMVGKLLNSADAMAAAKKMGVSFSDEQIKLGKHMFETGDIAGYQKLVLEELNKEFGGQAEAAAKADGGWAQFKDRLGEAAESIGGLVLPALNFLFGVLNDKVMPVVESLIAAFQTGLEGGGFIGGITNALYGLESVSPVFATIADGILSLAQSFDEGGIAGLLNDLIYQFTGIRGAAFPVVDAINNVIATFTDAPTPIQGFLNVLSQVSPVFSLIYGVVQQVMPTIRALVGQVLTDIVGYFSAHGAEMVSQVQTTWETLRATIASLVGPIAAVVQALLMQIMAFWTAHGQEILAFIGQTWAQINSIIQIALELIQATVVPALQAIAGFINAHGTDIQNILTNVWNIVRNIIGGALDLIKGVLQAALAVFKGDWQGAWTAIQTMSVSVTQRLWGIIKSFLDLIANLFGTSLSGILNTWRNNYNMLIQITIEVWDRIYRAIQAALNNAVNWIILTFQSILGAVRGFAGAAAAAAGQVGNAIVNGITSGIENGVGAIISAAKHAAQAALDAAMHLLDAHSPSREFMKVGGYISEGLALGITDAIPNVTGASADMARASLMGATNTTNNYTLNYQGVASDQGDVRTALRSQALLTGAMTI